MIEAGLIGARFLHYAAAMALFGVSLFPTYAYPGRTNPKLVSLSSWLRPVQFGLALAAIVSAALWLAFVAANMTGSLSGAVDPEALKSVLSDTLFGQVWAARLMLGIGIVGLTAFLFISSKQHLPSGLNLVLSGALLATLAGTGHTMHSEGMLRGLHIAADSVHLLAAGAWFGGLFALAYVLADRSPVAMAVLHRFSGMGYVAVAALVGSGLINSWYLVGSVSNLLATPYSQLLLVKLGLFSGMLMLAAANRFWLMPALTRDPSPDNTAAQRLRRHVVGEQALGVLIITVVSLLGTLEPAIGQS
ncbi:copper homeostasis membrane protein CopD [Hyphomicrobium sp. 2TAF46]|uniref:copper homeostasis membrane protein CopD n=1 Tax=Hyphomicrobium sp. 2TAF46 TaxID=3233019 RepID=UPI003F8F87A5